MKRLLIISALIACLLIAGCTMNQIDKGTLQFSSSPEGAQIYLDNQYKGTTPSTLADVSAGQHTLEFRYQGYKSYFANITVTTGNASYFASLTPVQTVTTTIVPTGPLSQTTAGNQPTITIQQNQGIMTIGSTQTFSGSCTGSDTVILVLYGPGTYTNGVQIAQVPVSSTNSWTYTWNPGNKVISGTYTMYAYDSQRTTTASISFSVVGGGTVSIIANPIKLSPGGTVTFSGLCTTGATSVSLTLYAPYSTGEYIATLPLNADNTWTYKYKFDLSRPTGIYTMFVSDAQNTASASVVVTLSS